MRAKHAKFIQEAIRAARKSIFRQRHGAVVVNNSRVVGAGFNYASGTGQVYIDGKHAEISALHNTTAKYRKDCAVYVVRLGKSDSMRNSKPCDNCSKIMRKLGVKYAWYFDGKGWRRDML